MSIVYNPAFSEIRVSQDPTADPFKPSIVALKGGGYVVAWQVAGVGATNPGIYAQMYTDNGVAVGAQFDVNEFGASQYYPELTATSDGGFAAVWYRGFDVYIRRFNPDGESLGLDTLVNTNTTYTQWKPDITTLADGGFVVVWSSIHLNNYYKIYGQRYDSLGTKVGGEFSVSTNATNNDKNDPVIAALGDGGFIVVWSSNLQDSDGFGVYSQRYDVNGLKVGGETLINTYAIGNQQDPAITVLSDGGYVISWQSDGQDGDGYGIFGQRFDANGLPVGVEFQINTYTTSAQRQPEITALSDGGFVVTWYSDGQDGSSAGIYAQIYSVDGNAFGSEIQVNTTTINSQSFPTITALENGGFVVVWVSVNADGTGTDIYQQIYRAMQYGSGADETLIDNTGVDWMWGMGGDDTLYGLTGNDIIHGGAGNDVLYGGVGSDRLKGNAGNDTLYGGAGNDFLKGQAGDDILIGGVGMDALRGGSGADTFVFNAVEDSTLTLNDRIMDFEQGIDIIDFSNIGGLNFIGSDEFSGTGGEIRAYEKNGNTILRIDVDGDGLADMKVFISGSFILVETDFLL